jgi:hypothetical protein
LIIKSVNFDNLKSGIVYLQCCVLWQQTPVFGKRNFTKKTMKISKYLTISFFLLFIYSCGIKSYRTFETRVKKINVFSDNEMVCDFSQVIYDNSNSANIYLDFKPTSDAEIVVEGLTGQINWQQQRQIISSPLLLSSINIGIFENGSRGLDSTFKTYSTISNKFKKISGVNNSLLYNINFRDTTLSFIPNDVDKLFIELDINIKSNDKIKHLKKTIELKADKHHYFWIFRDC